jgi:hypothetical protein
MKLPQLVILKFKDHCQGSHDARLIDCEAIGVLYKEDEEAYYLATWISEGVLDHNTEQFVIAKQNVFDVVVLQSRGKSRKVSRQGELRKPRQKKARTVDLSEQDKLTMLG